MNDTTDENKDFSAVEPDTDESASDSDSESVGNSETTEESSKDISESLTDDQETTEEDDTSLLNGIDNAASIEYAQSILNGVNYYYPSAKRETAVIENKEMALEYGLLLDGAITDLVGYSYTIKEIALVTAENMDSLPSGLSIARSFNVYSDKMHHTLQVSAAIETANIAEIGMLTRIPQDTVAKLIVKDASGTSETIDGVDWSTVEYIGFDIKNAGIFGYILPADGKYYARFLRLCPFAQKYNEGTYIDIAYVGVDNSLGTIKNCCKDMGSIQLSESNSATNPYTTVTNPYRYLDPASEYTLADKYFCFHVDTINGKQTDANNNKYGYNSVSSKGITEKDLNETLSGKTLSVGGWCPVQGGTEKYMWSVDGKNRYECGKTLHQSGDKVLSAANDMMSGAYAFTEADGAKGQYSITSTSRITRQTVDVRIAAIPTGSTDEICVFTSINGVIVASATN